jgi:hypothetical protein
MTTTTGHYHDREDPGFQQAFAQAGPDCPGAQAIVHTAMSAPAVTHAQQQQDDAA